MQQPFQPDLVRLAGSYMPAKQEGVTACRRVSEVDRRQQLEENKYL